MSDFLVHQKPSLLFRYWYVPVGIVVGIAYGLIAGMSPVLGLAAIFALVGGLLLLRYPYLALLITVALVPIERFGRFTDDNTEFTISLMRIMGLVALAVCLLHKILKKESLVFDKSYLLYGAYALMALLSITYTTDTLGTVRGASTVVGNLMFFFLVVNLAKNKQIIFQCILIWLAVSTFIAVYSTYDWHFGSGRSGQVVKGDDDPGKGVQTTDNRFSTVWEDKAELESLGGKSLRRTMGSTSHSAVYGINLIITIPFLLLLLRLPYSHFFKLCVWGSMVVVAYNIFLTNTRGTILVAGIVGLMCIFRGLYKFTRADLGLAVLALAGLIMIMPEDVFNRILDVSNYTSEKSASIRIRQDYLVAGGRAISENWFIGSGLANENIIPKYLDEDSNAPEKTTVHNEYVQTTMELGIIGFLCLFGFVILLIYYTKKAADVFKKNPHTEQEYWFMMATQIMMIGVCIYGLQVDVFHFPLKGWWLLAGITVVMYRMSQMQLEQQQVMDKEILTTNKLDAPGSTGPV